MDDYVATCYKLFHALVEGVIDYETFQKRLDSLSDTQLQLFGVVNRDCKCRRENEEVEA